jgi:hypothetical protein
MTDDEIDQLRQQTLRQGYEAGLKEGARIERLKRQGRPLLPANPYGRPKKGLSRKDLICETFGEGAGEALEAGRDEIHRRAQRARSEQKPK